MFSIPPIGLPAAIIGVTFIVLTSRWLLPDRRPAVSPTDDPRRYTLEMLVDRDGPWQVRALKPPACGICLIAI